MTRYEFAQDQLREQPRKWLVTGCAGFIGSNVLERLLALDQTVVGLDNFSTGKPENLLEVQSLVTRQQWGRFQFIEGDICRPADCGAACNEVEIIIHQAALGSVPRSLEDPVRSHFNNVTGFLNIMVAARNARVRRVVYASSSSVYGDHLALPKVEANIGQPLSPYAATKLVDEIYAGVFHRCYGTPLIGLRYFNVFGPRQDSDGAYAAVIPKWFSALLGDEPVTLFCDGETSRDFCYVENAVQANILAATTESSAAIGRVFNIACGEQTTLKQLFMLIRNLVAESHSGVHRHQPVFRPERAGDVRHSLADIRQAKDVLGYETSHTMAASMRHACAWYLRHAANAARRRRDVLPVPLQSRAIPE